MSQLTKDAAADFTASLSPSRTQICLGSLRDGTNQLFVMGADGYDPAQYTHRGTVNEFAGWGK